MHTYFSTSKIVAHYVIYIYILEEIDKAVRWCWIATFQLRLYWTRVTNKVLGTCFNRIHSGQWILPSVDTYPILVRCTPPLPWTVRNKTWHFSWYYFNALPAFLPFNIGLRDVVGRREQIALMCWIWPMFILHIRSYVIVKILCHQRRAATRRTCARFNNGLYCSIFPELSA